MTSSSSRKSPDSENNLPIEEEALKEHALPVEFADAEWLKSLCRDFFRKGFVRGYDRGIHDSLASSHVNDSRIVRPADVQLIRKPGG